MHAEYITTTNYRLPIGTAVPKRLCHAFYVAIIQLGLHMGLNLAQSSLMSLDETWLFIFSILHVSKISQIPIRVLLQAKMKKKL